MSKSCFPEEMGLSKIDPPLLYLDEIDSGDKLRMNCKSENMTN